MPEIEIVCVATLLKTIDVTLVVRPGLVAKVADEPLAIADSVELPSRVPVPLAPA